jgi:hypothetical protein
MSIPRHIAVIFSAALLLSGCAASTFPDLPQSFSPGADDASWPGFLPLEAVLGNDAVDFEQSASETRAVLARANSLRRRAVLLKRPVVDAAELLRLREAAQKGNP